MSSAIVPSLLLPGTRSDGGCLPLIRIASAGKLRQAIGDRRTMEGVIMRQARGCGRPRPGRGARSQGGGSVRTVVEFWRGGLPLGRAFWLWGILGGGLVELLATMFALALVVAGAPTWVIVLAFVAHVPWNLVLLVGVWRSAGRPEVGADTATLSRFTILVWVVVLSLL